MVKPNIEQMTLREKIGQMFFVRDDRIYSMINAENLQDYLQNNPIGGIGTTGRLKKLAEYLNFNANDSTDNITELKKYVLFSRHYINAYWYNDETQEAFVKGLFGEIEFNGISPFEL